MITDEIFNELKMKIEQMEINGGQVEQTPDHLEITVDPSATSGTTTLFGKVTAVTDANNYTVSVYIESDLTDTPVTSKSCYVMSLTDELAIDDVIPIQTTAIAGKDYESIQQMGAVG